jgi:hypothetical protein
MTKTSIGVLTVFVMILCYHTNLDKLPAVFIPIFLTIPLMLPLHLQVVYSSSLASWFLVQTSSLNFWTQKMIQHCINFRLRLSRSIISLAGEHMMHLIQIKKQCDFRRIYS